MRIDLIVCFCDSGFRPSVHQSFQQHEAELRSRFEAAETIGETGGDCDRAFVECLESPLDLFTQLTGHHDEFEEA